MGQLQIKKGEKEKEAEEKWNFIVLRQWCLSSSSSIHTLPLCIVQPYLHGCILWFNQLFNQVRCHCGCQPWWRLAYLTWDWISEKMQIYELNARQKPINWICDIAYIAKLSGIKFPDFGNEVTKVKQKRRERKKTDSLKTYKFYSTIK